MYTTRCALSRGSYEQFQSLLDLHDFVRPSWIFLISNSKNFCLQKQIFLSVLSDTLCELNLTFPGEIILTPPPRHSQRSSFWLLIDPLKTYGDREIEASDNNQPDEHVTRILFSTGCSFLLFRSEVLMSADRKLPCQGFRWIIYLHFHCYSWIISNRQKDLYSIYLSIDN